MTRWLRMDRSERRLARLEATYSGHLAQRRITVQPERKGWFRRFLHYMGYRDEVG